MKKIKIATTFFCGLLLMGCTENNNTTINQHTTYITTDNKVTENLTDIPVQQPQSSKTAAVETLKTNEDYKKIFPDGFPDTDGSTSAINLDAAVHAAYLGLDFSEVQPFILHTTTHNSFDKLINHKTDAIYTVPISSDQQSRADEAGFRIESVPVAKEGFVFIVNKNNPVDSLTQDQIKAIYSGEITNWSEVGGNDAEIFTYHRNTDSGSYNYMESFMGDKFVIPKWSIVNSMHAAIEAISEKDNRENGIAYSVFSYAADFENSTDIKIISIDGIAPSVESFKNKTYPLLSCTYFLFSADEPADSEIRKIAEFISSDKCKQAIEEAGYININ